MKPIEFVVFDGGSEPNASAIDVHDAMGEDIVILSDWGKEFKVMSYYLAEGKMCLDIEELNLSFRKTREEVANFIEEQFNYESTRSTKREKGNCDHYGKQELRELLDFIYGSKPNKDDGALDFATNCCEIYGAKKLVNPKNKETTEERPRIMCNKHPTVKRYQDKILRKAEEWINSYVSETTEEDGRCKIIHKK